MVMGADESVSDAELDAVEAAAFVLPAGPVPECSLQTA